MLGGSPFGHPLQQGFVTGLLLQVVNNVFYAKVLYLISLMVVLSCNILLLEKNLLQFRLW
jgi:hypothetical protein